MLITKLINDGPLMRAHTTALSPRNILPHLPPARRYWLAYSGGVDSTVLLDLLAAIQPQLSGQLSAQLIAIHINHGLQPNAASWAEHCVAQCQQRGIECVVEKVTVSAGKLGLEAAAREARYAAFAAHLQAGDVLLTAHHQDDQAETVLLRLLRGAGVTGLAAMRTTTPFAKGQLVRPLLGTKKTALLAYAQQHALAWVEDESNADSAHARNFVRHQILPALQQHWPAAPERLVETAQYCAEADELLAELAQLDIQAAATAQAHILQLPVIAALSATRRKNALRHWLKSLALPVPPAVKWPELARTLLAAAEDRNPVIEWPGASFRRYRHQLYALPALSTEPGRWQAGWDGQEHLALPDGYGTLALVSAQPGLELIVKFREGGERFKPQGSAHHRSLKTFLQEQDVPPWQRTRLPLVFCGEQLVAVADRWHSAELAANLCWQHPPHM